MSTYLTPGFILRSSPWREYDRLYYVFTPDYGKLELIAAGSRKSVSKLSPHLQPFAIVELMVACGRKYDRVAGACLVKSYFSLLNDPARLALASCFLEIIDRLTMPHQHERACYILLQESLQHLAYLPPSTRPEFRVAARLILCAFINKMLVESGISLRLGACVNCKLSINTKALYSWLNHGFVHNNCVSVDDNTSLVPDKILKKLALTVNQSDNMPDNGETLAFLVDYLEGNIGRRLQTIKVLRNMV